MKHTDKEKIKLLRKSLTYALYALAGKANTCELCGGDGEKLQYHKACTCYPIRKTLKATEK